MLRRAENVRVSFQPNIFTKKGWVTLHLGSRQSYRYVKVHLDQHRQAQHTQQTFPVNCGKVGERRYWLFQDKMYWDNDDLTAEQVHALLVTRSQRQNARIDRAQAIVAMGSQPRAPHQRGVIPDDVKQLVWTRDAGRCRTCGTTVELQFDHIIPVSLGGNSEPANLQLLCGPCNRRKGAGLTTGLS